MTNWNLTAWATGARQPFSASATPTAPTIFLWRWRFHRCSTSCANGRTMFTVDGCPIMCGCCGTRRPTPGRCQTWKSWWRSSVPVRSACACYISSLPNARPFTIRTQKPSSATWTAFCSLVAVRPAPSKRFPRTGWARLRSPCRPRGAPVGSPKVTARTPSGSGGG